MSELDVDSDWNWDNGVMPPKGIHRTPYSGEQDPLRTTKDINLYKMLLKKHNSLHGHYDASNKDAGKYVLYVIGIHHDMKLQILGVSRNLVEAYRKFDIFAEVLYGQQ